ncbi:MAG: polysaccharide pyruvyl transferase family protein [Phycisphaerae bacterium]
MVNIFCIRPKGFNIGNDVIYRGTLAFLQQAFGSQVNVISLPATSRYESHATAGLTPRTVHEINRYGHGVVVGGGNLYENGELEVDAGALAALEVPLFLYSLGAGRIYSRQHELVARSDTTPPTVLRLLDDKAAYSLVRDESTARLLRQIGCVKVETGGCPTLFVNESLPQIPTFDGTPEVLISIRTPELMNIPLRDQARVRSDVLEIVELLQSSGYSDIKLLCHDHRDLAFAASFDGFEYLYTDDALTYLGWLRSCRLNVAYRLHAVLPCLSLGTPTIGISYDERAISLMQTIGFGAWDINMITAPSVAATVADRLGRLAELPALCQSARPRWQALRERTVRTFEAFADDVCALANREAASPAGRVSRRESVCACSD